VTYITPAETEEENNTNPKAKNTTEMDAVRRISVTLFSGRNDIEGIAIST
jgi:hypothetical protein